MASKFRINIDTKLDRPINVHLRDGTRIIFKQCGSGLFYFETTNEDFAEDENTDYKFLNKVDSNNS